MNLPDRAFFAPRIKKTQMHLIESSVARQTTKSPKSNCAEMAKVGLISRPQKGTVGLTTK